MEWWRTRSPGNPRATNVLTDGAVLVIENDEELRRNITDRLVADGRIAIAAPHGVEALRLLAEPTRGRCVVLVDLVMQVVDVWKLLEALRDGDRLITLPVDVEIGAGRPTPSGDTSFRKRVVAFDALVAAVKG
jgi:CheY-like chemotaxis protein